jgi:hypothetical protein
MATRAVRSPSPVELLRQRQHGLRRRLVALRRDQRFRMNMNASVANETVAAASMIITALRNLERFRYYGYDQGAVPYIAADDKVDEIKITFVDSISIRSLGTSARNGRSHPLASQTR